MKKLLLLTALGIAAISVNAQWTTNPTLNTLAATGNDFVDPFGHADSSGNTLISFRQVTPMGTYGVAAQKLDALGNPLWGAGGVIVDASDSNQTFTTVYRSTVDTHGDLIIGWQDSRNNNDWDVFVSKVAPNGTLPWGNSGIQLSYGPAFDANPHVLAMPDSSVIIAWQSDDSTGIRLQRLSYDGTKMWGPLGILHHYNSGDPLQYFGYPELVICNDTSFYLLFKKANASFNASQQKFSMMKFGISSQTLFANDIDFQSIGFIPNISYIKALSDGNEGVVMGWLDSRINNFYLDGFVQHTDAQGNPLLTPDGVSISGLSTSQELGDIQILYGNNIIYAGSYATTEVYLQSIDASGNLATPVVIPFANTGSSSFQELNMAWSDDNILMTYDENAFPNDRFMYSIFDGSLNPLWTNQLATGNSTKSNSSLTVCKNHQNVELWEDDRSGLNIYAQNINTDGTIGVGVSEVNDFEMAIFPNPVSSQLNIRSFSGVNHVTILDSQSRIVMEKSGKNITEVDLHSLSAGTYYIKADAGRGVARKMFVVER